MDWWTLFWIVLGVALVLFMLRGCGGMMRGCGMGGCHTPSPARADRPGNQRPAEGSSRDQPGR